MNSLKIGNLELFPVETGRFRLDGGAMFGVVPKTLWSRQIPADDKNRIPMAMRCMLVKSQKTDRIYLIDNGCGNKFNEKMEKIYSLDYEHSNLIDSLSQIGVNPEEITDMVYTHLHFDHCGGTTDYDQEGNLVEVFPNATYHVNKRHWETANHPNDRETASFFPENIDPIKNSGRLNLTEDNCEFEEGFKTVVMDGHTEGQQLPHFTDGKKTIIYSADLFPTFAHIPLPWIMGYDMKPLQTLKEKKAFLKEAVENQWYIYMEHDAEHEIITINEENGKYAMDQSMKISDIE
ncbi:MBL fold metallo-hydrolase [Rhodohalobacter barkolensis]|uniref:MBL fold metallo-hydrolase n=1 Tax=Rhodohalobacter barkolensis TaxID=2053187 RepID=A0A2N0VJ21_9BACT|nr:MBL fold metallo-hydrolase [Rhodohalobacter barkolensis]PKD44197.1 MBL fold metallo-hydrolase [Rhodohalobacter barkolensis]